MNQTVQTSRPNNNRDTKERDVGQGWNPIKSSEMLQVNRKESRRSGKRSVGHSIPLTERNESKREIENASMKFRYELMEKERNKLKTSRFN